MSNNRFSIFDREHYYKLSKKKLREMFSSSFHLEFSGWRGPGVYSMKEVCWQEVCLTFIHPFAAAKPATVVQMELCLQ